MKEIGIPAPARHDHFGVVRFEAVVEIRQALELASIEGAVRAGCLAGQAPRPEARQGNQNARWWALVQIDYPP